MGGAVSSAVKTPTPRQPGKTVMAHTWAKVTAKEGPKTTQIMGGGQVCSKYYRTHSKIPFPSTKYFTASRWSLGWSSGLRETHVEAVASWLTHTPEAVAWEGADSQGSTRRWAQQE